MGNADCGVRKTTGPPPRGGEGETRERGTILTLKIKHPSKDEIPAQLQSLYVERDGAWVLDVEGAADNGKLEESRANNLARSQRCPG